MDYHGFQSIQQRIDSIESPFGWFVAQTAYDVWDTISLGTLSKVEAQENLGTLSGVGESTFTAARNVSNAASMGLQERIYETQMEEGAGIESIGKGALRAAEDMLPIAEADILANPEASAGERWRAAGTALAKTASLLAGGARATGKKLTIPAKKGMGTHSKSPTIRAVKKKYQSQARKGKLRKSQSPKSEQRKIWKKEHGDLDTQYDVDHIVEKQLGGHPTDLDNLAPLDKSYNRSAGSSIRNNIKEHRIGQRYDRVIMEGERVPVDDFAGIVQQHSVNQQTQNLNTE